MAAGPLDLGRAMNAACRVIGRTLFGVAVILCAVAVLLLDMAERFVERD